MDLSPSGREIKVLLAIVAWGLLIGPALAFGSIALGLNRSLAPVVMGVWYGGVILGLVIFLGLYFSRLARELGAGGVVAAIIWIGITVLLSRILYSMVRSLLGGP